MWRILPSITLRLTLWKFCSDVENVEEVFEEGMDENLIILKMLLNRLVFMIVLLNQMMLRISPTSIILRILGEDFVQRLYGQHVLSRKQSK